MWPRVTEILIGVWLLLSPFVFRESHTDWVPWAVHLGSGLLLIAFASTSFHARLHWVHLLTLPLAAFLVVFGYVAGGHPAAGAYQNQILVGLVLLAFGIIPNDATVPPRAWREYHQRQAEERHRARYGG